MQKHFKVATRISVAYEMCKQQQQLYQKYQIKKEREGGRERVEKKGRGGHLKMITIRICLGDIIKLQA